MNTDTRKIFLLYTEAAEQKRWILSVYGADSGVMSSVAKVIPAASIMRAVRSIEDAHGGEIDWEDGSGGVLEDLEICKAQSLSEYHLAVISHLKWDSEVDDVAAKKYAELIMKKLIDDGEVSWIQMQSGNHFGKDSTLVISDESAFPNLPDSDDVTGQTVKLNMLIQQRGGEPVDYDNLWKYEKPLDYGKAREGVEVNFKIQLAGVPGRFDVKATNPKSAIISVLEREGKPPIGGDWKFEPSTKIRSNTIVKDGGGSIVAVISAT